VLIHGGLEKEKTKEEGEKTRHLLDASAIPGPDLWADVVNYLLLPRLPSQCVRQTQIETRVIDQHNGVGFALLNFLQGFAKLLPKITVFPDHFPQTEDRGIAQPVFESLTGDRSHLRAAAPDEIKVDIAPPQ